MDKILKENDTRAGIEKEIMTYTDVRVVSLYFRMVKIFLTGFLMRSDPNTRPSLKDLKRIILSLLF